MPLFPSKISMFYDVFGGGGNLSLNADSEFVYYNDIVHYIGSMFDEIKGSDIDDCLNKVNTIIKHYGLSKTNEEGFLKLREDYNNGKNSWDYFYVLTCYSFNYQYRFNNNHGYNSSFGRNRSCFSQQMEKRFVDFVHKLNSINIVFDNKDFRDIDFTDADENDLIYCDPPYLISVGNYNDGKRGFKGWGEQDERDLYVLLDTLDRQGTRFALSNVLKHKGQSNDILKEWSKKYKINYLDKNYENCNYQAKNDKKTIEVLITNY